MAPVLSFAPVTCAVILLIARIYPALCVCVTLPFLLAFDDSHLTTFSFERFGSPADLLSNPSGETSRLVGETGPQNEAFLRSLVFNQKDSTSDVAPAPTEEATLTSDSKSMTE